MQTPVKGDGVINVRGQSSSDIQHRHLDGVSVARYAQVRAPDVRVDEQRQVGRVHVACEVQTVHLSEVVVAVFRELEKIPH